uniref:Uncharacterized protein n=1 Tax=Triticum urartu TaxID=4572 RepID=A0A8R7TNG7_TRIUA
MLTLQGMLRQICRRIYSEDVYGNVLAASARTRQQPQTMAGTYTMHKQSLGRSRHGSVGVEVLEQAFPLDRLVAAAAAAALGVPHGVHRRGAPAPAGRARGPRRGRARARRTWRLGHGPGPLRRLAVAEARAAHVDVAVRLLLARDQHERRGRRRRLPAEADERAHVPGGAADGGHEARERRGGGGRTTVAPLSGGGAGAGARELEDLEAVLGDVDAHAAEEVVVEVGGVAGLQLVARQHQRVLVHQRRLQPRRRQPRVPLHGAAHRA